MKKLRLSSRVEIFLLVLGIAAILGWFFYVIVSNAAYAQDAEPTPPASVDEILYTIDHDEDFQISA